MFRLSILLAIFSSTVVFAAAPGTYSQLKSELNKTSSKDLIGYVNGLISASAPSRLIGLPGHDKAVSYIEDTIKSLDPKSSGKLITSSTPADLTLVKKFYENDFNQKLEGKVPRTHPEYIKWMKFTMYIQNYAESKKDFPVKNIVWEKQGINSDKVLVVTAHYDTISHNKETFFVNEKETMPGANYNASGVAVGLSLIKVLAKVDLNYSVRVVFLDWQTLGFHGSEIYARELKNSGKTIMGVVNLEMLGQDTSYFDKTKKTGNMCAYVRDLSDEIKFVKKLVEHGSKITNKVAFEVKPNNFEQSDNFRFTDLGMLTATFTQNWEDDMNPKFYQTAQDTPETLNHETFWQAYQYVGGAVLGTLLDLSK